MLCDRCHKNEATLHLHQVVDGQVKKLHLCARCCEELGLDPDSPVSVTDVMLGMGMLTPAAPGRAERRVRCPQCGMTAAQLKSRGRLGCPQCYETFEKEILELVRALHRHDRHTGKKPRPRSDAVNRVALDKLRAVLAEMVAEECYEEAARLRDLINEYEQK